MDNLMLNNKIYLEGKVASELEFSHEMYGEGFYTFNLDVQRLSESRDILSITVSERLFTGMELKVGDEIIVEGQLRSYNKFVDGGEPIASPDLILGSRSAKSRAQRLRHARLSRRPTAWSLVFGRSTLKGGSCDACGGPRGPSNESKHSWRSQ